MNKKQAIAYFGGVCATARAVGITDAAVSRWPDVLSPKISDRIVAALVRMGRDVSDFVDTAPAAANQQVSEDAKNV